MYGQNELYHYGVKGMKWGVRRYENYGGSYTQRGVKRFRKAESDYDNAKSNVRKAKAQYKAGTTTKGQYKMAKNQVRSAKNKMKDAYGKLKNDKMADQGKMLYKNGKTITENNASAMRRQVGIVVGANVAAALLANSGNIGLASVSGRTIAIGGTAINAILAARTRSQNKKLRAYYAH